MIAHPDEEMSDKLGLERGAAIGIMTITPYEASIIAADCALKSADIQLSVVDRFTGSLVITGTVSSLEAALKQARHFLYAALHFDTVELTRS
ncbi:BMC domain-containing protein [Caproiciproducens sp.]